MGFLDVQRLSYVLPDGRVLFDDVAFRVGDGSRTALVGANGTGKTTLLRVVAGDLVPTAGAVVVDGGLGVMPQSIGSLGEGKEVRDLLLDLAPPAVREAGRALADAELAMMETDEEKTQLRYAQALADWGDAGGYDAEVLWDVCTTAALGMAYDACQYRALSTLSGGEQKRLALEALLRGPEQVLLLDEPDNFLDVPGKRWLEAALAESAKTVLFVSHDRELLHRTATRVVTIEAHGAWVHGGGFATYAEARQARRERLAELHQRWDEERERLRRLVITLREQARISPDMASRYHAMQTRFEKFEAAGPPPEQVVDQKVQMRLRGGRTGVRALTCQGLELTGLMKPFDLEVFYGERLAVLGSNGSGKSHFLRLLAGQPVAHARRLEARRAGRAGLVRAGPGRRAGRRAARPRPRDPRRRPAPRRRRPARARARRGDRRAAALRAARLGGRGVRPAQRRSAGALPGAAARAVRLHDAAARRADRQPRPRLGRGARGGAGRVRRDRAGRDARPVVRARVRPLPGLRLRRPGLRGAGAGVGRGSRGTRKGGQRGARAPGGRRVPAEVEVRRVVPEDWPALRALRLEALEDTPIAYCEALDAARALDDDAWRARAARGAVGGDSVQVLALRAGEPVATAVGFVEDGRAWLAAVYVTPAERGRALLARLLEPVAAWARGQGCAELVLEVHEDNARARSAYARLGFVDTGRRRPYPLDPSGDELEMALVLA